MSSSSSSSPVHSHLLNHDDNNSDNNDNTNTNTSDVSVPFADALDRFDDLTKDVLEDGRTLACVFLHYSTTEASSSTAVAAEILTRYHWKVSGNNMSAATTQKKENLDQMTMDLKRLGCTVFWKDSLEYLDALQSGLCKRELITVLGELFARLVLKEEGVARRNTAESKSLGENPPIDPVEVTVDFHVPESTIDEAMASADPATVVPLAAIAEPSNLDAMANNEAAESEVVATTLAPSITTTNTAAEEEEEEQQQMEAPQQEVQEVQSLLEMNQAEIRMQERSSSSLDVPVDLSVMDANNPIHGTMTPMQRASPDYLDWSADYTSRAASRLQQLQQQHHQTVNGVESSTDTAPPVVSSMEVEQEADSATTDAPPPPPPAQSIVAVQPTTDEITALEQEYEGLDIIDDYLSSEMDFDCQQQQQQQYSQPTIRDHHGAAAWKRASTSSLAKFDSLLAELEDVQGDANAAVVVSAAPTTADVAVVVIPEPVREVVHTLAREKEQEHDVHAVAPKAEDSCLKEESEERRLQMAASRAAVSPTSKSSVSYTLSFSLQQGEADTMEDVVHQEAKCVVPEQQDEEQEDDEPTLVWDSSSPNEAGANSTLTKPSVKAFIPFTSDTITTDNTNATTLPPIVDLEAMEKKRSKLLERLHAKDQRKKALQQEPALKQQQQRDAERRYSLFHDY